MRTLLYLQCMPAASLSSDTATVVTMLEDLPAAERKVVVEKVRSLIAEWDEEREWDDILAKNPEKLKKIAREARQEIAEGKVSPMEF